MSFKEIQVPVPWGFVAGKSWGDENRKRIVAFHGFQDNANSFDNIIPYLPKSFHYLCFDLPSHGKSSYLISEGFPSIFDFVLAIKLILDHLNDQKSILMGHSFGAQACLFFTQLYPERVEKLITLDTAYYLPCEPYDFMERMREKMRLYSKLHKLKEDTAPTYLLEEAIEKMKNARVVSISDESATALLQRALEPAGDDKYKFRLAQHLKYLLWTSFTIEYEVELINSNPIKCPHLLIMASKTKPYYIYMKDVLEAFSKTNKHFQAHTIKGTHDVHIESPDLVAKYINKFLLSNKL